MEDLSIVHTPCKNCVFAKYTGKTQTGCALDYIDKYKAVGAEVIEAYDNELEFFIINKRKCHGYRENSWFLSRGLDPSSTIEDKIKYVKDNTWLTYTLVINFIKIGSTQHDILQLLSSLKTIKIPPSRIIFIRPSNGGETTIYQSINKLMLDAGLNTKWKIQTMVDDSLSNENILHNAINENKNTRLICSLNNSICNIGYLIERANNIIYNDLSSFTVLTDKQQSAFVFSSGVYKYSLLEYHKDILQDKNNFTIV